ncbi:MAG: hypothetical protein RMY64_34745 [Nostoc sp. DedQUE08]|uniref:hypothetical protein n=1 Tax=Nostoc sp. DedQUE08 TaxID=3075393 RepID=UPI002AD32106|nr:hypothetical protein [Nostoc sp. DedQUE08]MDZ8070714.1 hypothetical protein [Nostoc sp. DedQUE08]
MFLLFIYMMELLSAIATIDLITFERSLLTPSSRKERKTLTIYPQTKLLNQQQL